MGSLYTVVQNLEKHGFVEPVDTTRQGRRPERTVYAITPAGRAELRDWMRELLAEPQQEFTSFEAALSNGGVLSPDEVIELAEAAWVRSILTELVDGTMPGVDQWRVYHQKTKGD